MQKGLAGPRGGASLIAAWPQAPEPRVGGTKGCSGEEEEDLGGREYSGAGRRGADGGVGPPASAPGPGLEGRENEGRVA